ncbi:MAG TPA: BBP7 family outer membrane beta-barrel protein [Planctomycetaceae bacterium]|nr:BBP7 family outer membrane beta-barrel protein [Planctomycetaceae bacterium]
MAIRHSFCLLFAALISVSGNLWAQTAPYWAQGPSYSPAGYGSYPDQPYAAPGVSSYQQAGYYHPNQMPPQDIFVPDANIITTDPGDDRPLGLFLQSTFARSWVRLEYMNWSLDAPGNQLLGAQFDEATGVVDVRDPFPVFDGNAQFLGFAHVNDLSTISIEDNNGIRGTFGKETTWGEFQANVWGIEAATGRFVDPTLPEIGVFAGTTTTTQGALSNNVFLWDESFTANYSTDLWGGEVKFLLDRGVWPEGFSLRPLVGFQYVEIEDHLVQIGQFNAQGTQITRTGIIDSRLMNTMFGPTLGAHMKGEIGPVTIGFEPKVALALSSIRGRVSTFQLRSFADGLDAEEDTNWTLAPILQANFYLRIRVNEYLSLFGSWDASYFTRVGRAGDSIDYNDNATFANPNPPPDIGYTKVLNGLFMEGFTFGGELMLW